METGVEGRWWGSARRRRQNVQQHRRVVWNKRQGKDRENSAMVAWPTLQTRGVYQADRYMTRGSQRTAKKCTVDSLVKLTVACGAPREVNLLACERPRVIDVLHIIKTTT